MTIAVDWDVKQENKQTNKRLKEKACADPEDEGTGISPTPERSQSYKVSYKNWSESIERSQSYQAKI